MPRRKKKEKKKAANALQIGKLNSNKKAILLLAYTENSQCEGKKKIS